MDPFPRGLRRLSLGDTFDPLSTISSKELVHEPQICPFVLRLFRGGGIGGLTLAVALSQAPISEELIEVDIYESAPALTQVGAGITVWPRAWDIFSKLGIGSDLAAHIPPGQNVPTDEPRLNFRFRKSDHEEGIPLYDLTFAGAALFFHRSLILDSLQKRISPSFRFHLSHRLANYTESGDKTLELSFENGARANCDLLVGADGIKSNVRRCFMENDPKSEPVWSGCLAYRCMVPMRRIIQRLPGHRVLATPMIYCGKNKHIVAYPLPDRQMVNIIAYITDPLKEGCTYDGPSFVDVTNDEVISIYAGWEEEVVVIVESMENASRWAIHALNPLDSYARDGVVLLGDAAHAMTPHQGNGAGQSIEDAYVLAHLLASALHNELPISKVTEVYDAVRQPFGNFVQEASRKHGMLYQFNMPEFADVQEGDPSVGPERLRRLGESVLSEWEYAWSTRVDADLERALGMLGLPDLAL